MFCLVENDAIPVEVVSKLSVVDIFHDALHDVRSQLINNKTDSSHVSSTWRHPLHESREDMVRTVDGIYIYCAKLNQYKQEEVDKQRFFVEDPITGIQHDEWEDHNHLEKRIGQHTLMANLE